MYTCNMNTPLNVLTKNVIDLPIKINVLTKKNGLISTKILILDII